MAYDRQHLSLTWLFRVLTTDEIAITSINYSVLPVWTGASAALEEVRADDSTQVSLIGRMGTLLANSDLCWATFSQLFGIKIAAIAVDGTYLSDPVERELGSPVTGSSAATLPQTTVVASLRSGSGLGTANNGRMFLPHTRMVPATGTPAAAAATTLSINNSFNDFVNGVTTDLTAVITDPVQPFIMSKSAPAPSKPVLRTRIGNITDTQRRRRDQLVELYNDQPL
jgi:hypothetical protein